ncbi:MAG: iron complex outermembrane receptor protein, partial [Flavobacteriales bacterium]
LNFSIGYVISKGANSIEMIAFATNLMNRTYIDHMSRYKILNLTEVGRNVGITINYKF